MNKKNALKWLGIYTSILLFSVAFCTFLFDPFFQYHEPYFGLKKVFNNRDYQMIGSIRHLSYDSVLVGSSVAENFNSSFIDENYNCQTLKIIRASGSCADLLHYLNIARQKQNLSNVFWCMDIFALTAPTEVTVNSDDSLKYLHTDTVLDDATYLFNKDVLFQEIPLYIASSVMNVNTDGHAYDWSDGKEFSAKKAMSAYMIPDRFVTEQDYTESLLLLEQNLENVLEEIHSHPETEYTILFPPYSMLYWHCGYTNGFGELYFMVLEKTLPSLVNCENVKVYYFQSEQEIICNLDYYMDMIHYRPEINQYMLDCVAQDSHRVTKDNIDEVLIEMRQTYHYIIEEGIYKYYDAGDKSNPEYF